LGKVNGEVFELVLEEAMKDRIEKIERELVMLSYHEKSECSINVRGSLNVYYIACTEVVGNVSFDLKWELFNI